jgi:hypothetical protein
MCPSYISLMNNHVPREETGLNCLGEQPCPPRKKGLKLPWGTTMFLEKQMYLKFYVTLIFSFELWLKCCQLQSCNPTWELSNDRSQAYIKTNMRWLWLQNNLEHDCSPKNLGLSSRKIHFSMKKLPLSLKNLGLSPRKVHCSLRNLGPSQK